MAPGRERLQAVAAAADGQAPVVHGAAEGTDRCLKSASASRKPGRQVGRGRDGASRGSSQAQASARLTPTWRIKPDELREFPAADRDGEWQA